jgi:hypothetical protein
MTRLPYRRHRDLAHRDQVHRTIDLATGCRRTSTNPVALHKVIQAAMGWLDCHLWELAVDEHKYGIPDPDRPDVKSGATTQLTNILASGRTEFGYVYELATTGNM